MLNLLKALNTRLSTGPEAEGQTRAQPPTPAGGTLQSNTRGFLDLMTEASNRKTLLYSAPGQRRFSFIWHQLSKGAAGFVILTDNSRRLPLSDLSAYLDHFGSFLKGSAVVIGITRADTPGRPSLEDYRRFLADRGEAFPVVSADGRQSSGVLMLLSILRASREFAGRSVA